MNIRAFIDAIASRRVDPTGPADQASLEVAAKAQPLEG